MQQQPSDAASRGDCKGSHGRQTACVKKEDDNDIAVKDPGLWLALIAQLIDSDYALKEKLEQISEDFLSHLTADTSRLTAGADTVTNDESFVESLKAQVSPRTSSPLPLSIIPLKTLGTIADDFTTYRAAALHRATDCQSPATPKSPASQRVREVFEALGVLSGSVVGRASNTPPTVSSSITVPQVDTESSAPSPSFFPAPGGRFEQRKSSATPLSCMSEPSLAHLSRGLKSCSGTDSLKGSRANAHSNTRGGCPLPRYLESQQDCKIEQKAVNVFTDGVYDLTHPGHFNAVRQASLLGSRLVVGVASDEEVLRAKGVYPIYSCEERVAIISACKWVDQVISNVPYKITPAIIEEAGCDFATHGDDIALDSQGVDSYAEVRKVGRLKIFKRTQGVSTTTLVSRLLAVVDTVPIHHPSTEQPQSIITYVSQMSRKSTESNASRKSACTDTVAFDDCRPDESVPTLDYPLFEDACPHSDGDSAPSSSSRQRGCCAGSTSSTAADSSSNKSCIRHSKGCMSDDHQAGHHHLECCSSTAGDSEAASSERRQCLICSKLLLQFMGAPKTPPDGPNKLIVYTHGSFDVFHPGHVRVLQKAKQLGTFLIVGIYDDAVVRKLRGPGYPVQTMLERALSVMAMRVVDEVIIGAPLEVSELLLKSFQIDVVARCVGVDAPVRNATNGATSDSGVISTSAGTGITVVDVVNDSTLNTEEIVKRIIGSRDKLQASITVREAKESKYIQSHLEAPTVA